MEEVREGEAQASLMSGFPPGSESIPNETVGFPRSLYGGR